MPTGTRLVLATQIAIIAGAVSPGALLNFYVTGTSTRTDTYADVGLTVPNANPVVADGAGLLPPVFLDPAVTYKTVLTDADGANGLESDPVDSNVTAIVSGLGLGTAAFANLGTVGAVVPLLTGNNQYGGNNVHNGLETFLAGASMVTRAQPPSTDVGYLGWPQVRLGADHHFVNTDVAKNIVFSGTATATIDAGILNNDPSLRGLLLRATWLTGTGTMAAGAGVTLRWPNGNLLGARTVTAPGFIIVEQMDIDAYWVVGGANVS